MVYDDDEIKQSYLYWRLCKKAISCVKKHEKKRKYASPDDCYIREDNLGSPQILFYVVSLNVLTPRLIRDLRKIMEGYARWEIVVIICPPDESKHWPEMGLRIREREIVDDLQRQYLPQEFQGIYFEDAGLEPRQTSLAVR